MTEAAPVTVVLATRNRHKVVEIAALLADLPLRLVGIDELAPGVTLVEDRDSFEGNAYAKAEQAAAATGLPSLADDSGLEVDALGGDPGVWSARYAGEPSDDGRNNDKLLRELTGDPSVTVTGRAVGRRKSRAVKAIDGGVLRHPLFGDRNQWVAQKVRSGFWSDPMNDGAPAIRAEILQGIVDANAQVIQEVGK
jgi:hypothetical protein